MLRSSIVLSNSVRDASAGCRQELYYRILLVEQRQPCNTEQNPTPMGRRISDCYSFVTSIVKSATLQSSGVWVMKYSRS